MKIPIRDYWSLLVDYLRPQRRRVVLLAVLLLGSIVLQLANPQILRYFIDAAQQGRATEALMIAAALFIGFALANQFLSVSATYVSENVGWTATNWLRSDLALHCLRLDLGFHKTRTPGELIERIDGDVTAMANFFSQFVIQVIGNALLLVGVLLVLFGTDWRVGLTLTIFSSIVLVILNAVQRFAVPYWKTARQASAELFGFLEERLAGTEDIRSNGATDYTMQRLYERLRHQLTHERKARIIGSGAWMVPIMFGAIGTIVTFVLGNRFVTAGSMTVGTAYVIFYYTDLLIRPMMMITRQLEDLQKAGAGIVRVRELYEIRSAVQDGPGATLPDGALPVEFDRVAFAYEAGDTTLHDISVRIEAGRVLGILGRTGSGKTTLTRLLFRLYDVSDGVIRLGGVDARDATLHELRRRVGIVTQDVQLFNASIRDNLTFFDESIEDGRINAVLDDLGLTVWRESLPRGLDTALSGGGLSAGEAQLLAFARVFLHDPGLVILDEASSRLDPATERLIERAIDKLLRGRSAIIVAHRLGTVQRADDILILDNGRISEYGAREQLAHDPESRFYGLLQTGMEDMLV